LIIYVVFYTVINITLVHILKRRLQFHFSLLADVYFRTFAPLGGNNSGSECSGKAKQALLFLSENES